MQQRALIPLARALAEMGKRVEIETNGTYPPAAELTCLGVHFNVSPKLANAGCLPRAPSGRTRWRRSPPRRTGCSSSSSAIRRTSVRSTRW